MYASLTGKQVHAAQRGTVCHICMMHRHAHAWSRHALTCAQHPVMHQHAHTLSCHAPGKCMEHTSHLPLACNMDHDAVPLARGPELCSHVTTMCMQAGEWSHKDWKHDGPVVTYKNPAMLEWEEELRQAERTGERRRRE